MAAYNYYGQNFPYAPVYPANYQQQMNVPQIQQQNQPSIIWVSNEYEAERYPVAPNNAVTLWSTSEPVVYLKQTDPAGKPTITIYDLVERKQSASKGASDGKPVEYAKQSDLVAVAGAVKSFDELLSGIKSDIETMKSDLYGVAGRKKVRKPKEEGEDDE